MLYVNERIFHKHHSTQTLSLNETVKTIQADGDELEMIREQFKGIPMHNGRVVMWEGEYAKFIFDNIDLRS